MNNRKIKNQLPCPNLNTHCALVVTLSEKASANQCRLCGNRKYVIHARVFPQALAHGDSSNKINHRKTRETRR